ncbi:hypothetical protein RFI_21372, partial [Reticulomyxa filosa]
MDKLQLCYGDVVELSDGKKGVVKYIGHTDFFPGRTWFGIELETNDGKHDGRVKSRVYFKCSENHGVFVQSKEIVTILKSMEAKKKEGEGGRMQIYKYAKKKKIENEGEKEIALNEIVEVNNYGKGRVRFVGQTMFDETGIWYGIELVGQKDKKVTKGNTNGSIDNI